MSGGLRPEKSLLDRRVEAAVRAQPDPPRHVPLGAFIRAGYGNAVALIFVTFALFSALTGVLVWWSATGEWWAGAIVLFVCGAGFVLFAVAPLVRVIRYHRAARHGILVPAAVTNAEWTAPELRPETIEAGKYGMARGTRRIAHPKGAYEERFESDSPWASELKPGTRVWLLVDPDLPRVLMDLGPGLTFLVNAAEDNAEAWVASDHGPAKKP